MRAAINARDVAIAVARSEESVRAPGKQSATGAKELKPAEGKDSGAVAPRYASGSAFAVGADHECSICT